MQETVKGWIPPALDSLKVNFIRRYIFESFKTRPDTEFCLKRLGVSHIPLCRSPCMVNRASNHPLYSFIRSFIPDIYIAPLQETYSEALSCPATVKKKCIYLY